MITTINITTTTTTRNDSGSIPEFALAKHLPDPMKAAGAELTHSLHGDIITQNNNPELNRGPVVG